MRETIEIQSGDINVKRERGGEEAQGEKERVECERQRELLSPNPPSARLSVPRHIRHGISQNSRCPDIRFFEQRTRMERSRDRKREREIEIERERRAGKTGWFNVLTSFFQGRILSRARGGRGGYSATRSALCNYRTRAHDREADFRAMRKKNFPSKAARYDAIIRALLDIVREII